MSLVHYKFKSTLEYKTLTFNGLHVSVEELKRLISEKENIRIESFDLKISNAHTKRDYTDTEVVPRNSSVLVQRIPREDALKLPKVHDTSTSGVVGRQTQRPGSKAPAHIPEVNYSKMSEKERIDHIKAQSTEKYSTANYNRRPSSSLNLPPPPSYVCNRCSGTGHWSQKCPMLNTRRTTGIPFEELMETTKDDPNAMLHQATGKYVIPIMHYEARQHKKKEVPLFELTGESQAAVKQAAASSSPISTQQEVQAVPAELACSICKSLLRDAVLAVCCGDSFCAECIQQKVLEDPQQQCPGSGCARQIALDSIVPNQKMRLAVQKFLSKQYPTAAAKASDGDAMGPSSSTSGSASVALLHKLLPVLAGSPSPPPATDSSFTKEALPPPSKAARLEGDAAPVQPQIDPVPANIQPSAPQTQSQGGGGLAPNVPRMLLDLTVPPPPLPSTAVRSTSGIPLPDLSMPPPPIARIGFSSAPEMQQSAQEKKKTHATHSQLPPSIITGSLSRATGSSDPQHGLDKGINEAWESFLKRKDEDKLMRELAILRPPGAELSKDGSVSSHSSHSFRSSSRSPRRSPHHNVSSGYVPRHDRRRDHNRSPSLPRQYRRQGQPTARNAQRFGPRHYGGPTHYTAKPRLQPPGTDSPQDLPPGVSSPADSKQKSPKRRRDPEIKTLKRRHSSRTHHSRTHHSSSHRSSHRRRSHRPTSSKERKKSKEKGEGKRSGKKKEGKVGAEGEASNEAEAVGKTSEGKKAKAGEVYNEVEAVEKKKKKRGKEAKAGEVYNEVEAAEKKNKGGKEAKAGEVYNEVEVVEKKNKRSKGAKAGEVYNEMELAHLPYYSHACFE